MIVSLLFLACLASPPQDDEWGKVPDGYEVKLKLSIKKVGGDWVYELEGTTNLPKGTFLRARIFALDEYMLQGEKTLDEEPLIYDDPFSGTEAYVDYEVDGSDITIRLYEFGKRPFSLPYRGRVFYEAARQSSEEIVKKLGEKKWSAMADFQFGTTEDLKAERKQTAKDLDAELRKVMDLYADLRNTFDQYRKKKEFDEKAWIKWKTEWHRKVEQVRSDNLKRYDLWAVWIERQGKLRIEGFCDSFDRLVKDMSQFFGGDPEALQLAMLRMQSFVSRMEEAREVIGVDTPINPDEVRKLIGDYEAAALKLEAWAKAGAAPDDWSDKKKDIIRRGRQVLLNLVQHLPRRGYARIVDLLGRFTRLFDGCEKAFSGADGVDLKKLVEEHHARLMEFRQYAGMK